MKSTAAAPPEQNGSVPSVFLKDLKRLEPDAQFEFFPPDLVKSSDGVVYYAKMGTIPRRTHLYRAEVKLLKLLEDRASGFVPKALASGTFVRKETKSGPETYRTCFLYGWEQLRPLTSDSAKTLARSLARKVHSCEGSDRFGIYNPTSRSSTPTEGGSYPSWKECYKALIAGALSRLPSSEYAGLRQKGEEIKKRRVFITSFDRDCLQPCEFRRVIPVLLNSGKLMIRPVLIHGNLWNNYWVRPPKLSKKDQDPLTHLSDWRYG